MLKQADTCKKILKEFRSLAEAKKFRDRVFRLTTDFATHRPSQTNHDQYQILDTKINNCLLSAAAEVVKQTGYKRSPHLTKQGASLHFWKAALSAKTRKVPLGTRAVNLATRCDIDLHEIMSLTTREIWKKVPTACQILGKLKKKQYKRQLNDSKKMHRISHVQQGKSTGRRK